MYTKLNKNINKIYCRSAKSSKLWFSYILVVTAEIYPPQPKLLLHKINEFKRQDQKFRRIELNLPKYKLSYWCSNFQSQMQQGYLHICLIATVLSSVFWIACTFHTYLGTRERRWRGSCLLIHDFMHAIRVLSPDVQTLATRAQEPCSGRVCLFNSGHVDKLWRRCTNGDPRTYWK
jgi:hypothetical protein